jgi:hypothetical protein
MPDRVIPTTDGVRRSSPLKNTNRVKQDTDTMGPEFPG